jgi:hypothetical protein
MKWYVAKLVFQIICGEGNHTAQFDEQLRLVQSEDEDSAFAKQLHLAFLKQKVFITRKINWCNGNL